MIEPFKTNAAARFMFIHDDEPLFCTSDLDHFKTVLTHKDIGQIGTGEIINLLGREYEIEDISIEHYSWPTNLYQEIQSGKLYDYTINITVYLTLP